MLIRISFKRLQAPLGLIFVVLLLAFPLLSKRKCLVMGDIAAQFLPWEVLVRESFREYRLPLWNSGALGGYPLLANFQSSPFYFPDLLLSFIDILWFFNISLLIHLAIATLGTYALARRLDISPAGSCLAALGYGLSGFIMIHVPFGNHLTIVGLSWIPWIFLGAVWCIRSPDTRAIIISSFAIALQIYAGHPQMFVYGVGFASLFFLFSIPWRDATHPKLPMFAAWIGSMILAFCLAGMQLLPALEWIPYTARSTAIDFKQATEFGFAPHRLITLFQPDFFGSHIQPDNQHWDHFVYWSNAYVGGTIVVLAMVPFYGKMGQRRIVWSLLGVGVLALLCACGRDNPFYHFVLQLPGFKHFRAPAKFLPVFMLCLTLLGGMGLDALQREPAKRLWKKNLYMVIPLIGILAVYGWYGVPARQRLEHHADITTALLSVRWLFLLCGLILTYYLVRSPSATVESKVPWFIVAVVGLDLIAYGRPWIDASLLDRRAASLLIYPTADIRWLKQKQNEEGYFRIASSSQTGYPNALAMFGLSNLSGYDPMAPATTINAIADAEHQPSDRYRDDVSVTQANSILSHRFVRYVVLAPSEVSPSDSVVWSNERVAIVELAEWHADRFSATPLSEGESSRVLESSPTRWNINVKLQSPRTLILPITYAPGWQATVGDSQSVRLSMSSDGLVQLDLPSGESQLQLRYAPRSIYFGITLSCVGTIVIALLVIYGKRGTLA